MLVLEGDGFLDLVVFGSDPGIIDIAVAVESSECLETFIWAIVVYKPTTFKQVSFRIEAPRTEILYNIPWTFGEEHNQCGCAEGSANNMNIGFHW
jgi:hypothetical protein